MMTPTASDRIELVASNAHWPEAFASELARLRAALAAHGELAIEHIGSTTPRVTPR